MGVPPEIATYMLNVCDNVYGDDKFTFVSDAAMHYYNGATYEKVMNSIGLGFTPADKGEWTYKTRPYDDCTFLKRGFVYHRKIGGIVAPLEEKSMCSTLNFVKDDFRNHELTLVKLYNFQREAFLHQDKYDEYIDHIMKYAEEKDVVFTPLTEEYLLELYHSNDYASALELS